MAVIDSTALVSFLLLEPGSEIIGDVIETGSISAVSHAEMIGRFGYDGIDVKALLDQLAGVSITTVPFDREQADIAGALIVKHRAYALSMGDAATLALAQIRGEPVYTRVGIWRQIAPELDVRLLGDSG